MQDIGVKIRQVGSLRKYWIVLVTLTMVLFLTLLVVEESGATSRKLHEIYKQQNQTKAIQSKAKTGGFQKFTVEYTNVTLALDSISSLHQPQYLFFISSFVDGKLWCRDSERVYEAVNKLVKEVEGVLLEIYVGSKNEWKSWQHPLRKEPFNLKCVPTIVRWNQGSILDIIDEQLEGSQNLKDAYILVENFIYKNKD